ncbi:MAG: hypothetical protein Q9181_003512 [Wetmoreana brouardii]
MPYSIGPVSCGAYGGPGRYLDSQRHSAHKEALSPSAIETNEAFPLSIPKSDQQSQPKQDRRTIILNNLPDRTTHKDIISILRGGSLLDVYLRPQEKAASVSFVESTAAEEFLAYVKRNDVYIHNRRVTFSWSERQFYMPGHVANKVARGATRNLVIQDVKPNITEQRLRDDLDHIHNLVIISISFANGDVYLSLNSIHNSLFARTCMLSRALYKGLRIEWYPDECALPLPKQQISAKRESAPPPKTKAMPMINRFQMLDMDDDATEDSSSGAAEEDLTMTTGFSSLQTSRRSPWGVPTVAA